MIQNVSTYTEVNRVLGDVALPRQINAELAELGDLLRHTDLYDESTNLMREWHAGFTYAFRRTGNHEGTLREFTEILKEILQDPITGTLVDPEVVLGSDHNAYGGHSLLVFQHTAPQPYRYRSPIDRDNPAPFSSRPHDILRWAVNWYARRNELNLSSEFEERYQQLRVTLARNAPRSREEMRRYREEREAMRRAQAEEVSPALEEQLRIESETQIEAIQGIYAEMMQESQQITDPHLEQIHRIQVEDQTNAECLQAEMDRLDQEVVQLDGELEQLEESIAQVGDRLEETEKANLEMQVIIKKTKKAIKKARRARVKGLAKTVVIACACAAASWGMTAALQGSGMTASASSFGSSGIKFTGTITF